MKRQTNRRNYEKPIICPKERRTKKRKRKVGGIRRRRRRDKEILAKKLVGNKVSMKKKGECEERQLTLEGQWKCLPSFDEVCFESLSP